MIQKQDNLLPLLVDEVRSSKKYAQLSVSLVEKVGASELNNHKRFSDAVDATRARLHQISGAFFSPRINFQQWKNDFNALNPQDSSKQKELSLAIMRLHRSTSERLSFIDEFYTTCLSSISPISSVLDIACGLNPLAYKWMPLSSSFRYEACDVIIPLIDFLVEFFKISGVEGNAFECDLTQQIPSNHVQLALLLKTVPCLDQLDKNLSERLIKGLNADHILISFPIQSLSGKSKGMKKTYSERFDSLIQENTFVHKKFLFKNEIVFLLSRND